MNIKRAIIICLIICIIFSLHAVSAVSDENATDDIATSSTDVSTVSLSNENDLLGNDNEESFTSLNTKVSPGGTVVLDKNYTYDSSSDSSLQSGIVINKDTIIDGRVK